MPFPFLAAATMLAPVLGAGIQSAHNRGLAKFQNRYNSPAAQMKRFKDAGLNPNLVYTQGNSGNMSPITPTNWQSAVGDAPARFTQSELAQTQADVGQQKIEESKTKQDVLKAQEDVLRANPNLDPEYLGHLVQSMIATSKLKQQEANYLLSGNPDAFTNGQRKIASEIEALAQRNGLLGADQKVKAEIIKSQQFQNQLREIQVNWLKDGDLTPQHMLNGIMLLLSKMF